VQFIFVIALILQIGLLLTAAWYDVASRLIPDQIGLGLAAIGIIIRLLAGPLALAESLAVTTILFFILLLLHKHRVLGGGDVKLLVALAIGLAPMHVVHLFTVTALAGGVLCTIHLALRNLPRPHRVATKSILRRVYIAERWRILRRWPLPYGVAIACGGIWAVLLNSAGVI
jgi:prepilin peptidase CpaA